MVNLKDATITFKITGILKETILITVHIKGYRWWRIKSFIAKYLIRLGCWMANLPIVFENNKTND